MTTPFDNELEQIFDKYMPEGWNGNMPEDIRKSIEKHIMGREQHIKAPYDVIELQKAFDNGSNARLKQMRKALYGDSHEQV